jgi:hypothetical protein
MGGGNAVSGSGRAGRRARERPLFDVVLEKLYLLGLASLFFGPLAAVNATPPGSPLAKQVLAPLAALAGGVAYMIAIMLVGRFYHSRRDERQGSAGERGDRGPVHPQA